jgi:N-acetylglucosamine-6-sulfatase
MAAWSVAGLQRRAVALAMLVGTVVPATAHGAANGDRPQKPPNIVLITTDDQAAHTVRPDTMPNLLSRVGANATTFTNALASTPLCCPSRASMLTGQYPHNNGVLKNDYGQLREKTNTLPKWLDRAGYTTIHVGKYLNLYRKARGPESRPAPGWDVWQSVKEPVRYYEYDFSANGHTVHYGSTDGDYLTDVLNRKAGRLVRSHAPRKRPFFLQFDQYAPHDSPGRGSGPCHGGHDAVPAPSEETLYADEPLPRPPSFDEGDVSDKPSFVRRATINVGTVTREYRCGLASLRAADRGIGAVHDALREAGELKKTVIIFISDNGYLFGEHRLRFKLLPYEEAIRVPLMISLPKRLRDGAPRIRELSETVANIDIAPTIVDLADATPCKRKRRCRVMDGRSLVPLLRGERADWPRDRGLVVEFTGRFSGFASCSYRGIRTPDHLYVQHTLIPNLTTGICTPGLEVEHYDLSTDPFQLENLHPAAAGSVRARQERDLASRLAALQHCAGIAGRDAPRRNRPFCE